MKCLRCGYCCINYCVVVVKDPKLGIVENNMIFHEGKGPCIHLTGNKPGNYSCAIHNEEWYKETPCFDHGQFERVNSNCRIGEHLMKNVKQNEFY